MLNLPVTSNLIAGVRGNALPGITSLPLNLASFASIRGIAADTITTLDGQRIDALVLNAGGQRPTIGEISADGHELTFAANHLGHFLLLNLLRPHLADGARIVITTSGTHNPAEKSGLPPPDHADARLLANPQNDPQRDRSDIPAGLRAYTASKLCNLMTARHAATLPDLRARGISVVAYDPGLIPGTGLVRHQMWVVRALVWPLLPLFVGRSRQMNTLADAGQHLALLASELRPPPDKVYAALRNGRLGWPSPSVLACDDAACARLWDDSAALCGL
jgi:NAD(P)-dependent dehydrogenase (short-subunit alcohol dehydrogenase family)